MPCADLKVEEACGASPWGSLKTTPSQFPFQTRQQEILSLASHSLLGTLTQQVALLVGPLPLRLYSAVPAPEHC